MGRRAGKNELFVRDFIPKVSRTFALAIKFLPPGLRHSVFTAYLLCRVADTIEDSPHIGPAEKRSRLLRLRDLLAAAESGQRLAEAQIAPLYDSIDHEHGHDHRLLARSSELFDILTDLPRAQQNVIYRWAGEMAGGMAEFSQLAPADCNSIGALRDLAEWDRYCYYVAGTVGEMMTELFVMHYRIAENIAVQMKELGKSFGLGLQKVNVIKDVPDDRKRGVCFLPLDIMQKHGLAPDSLNDPARAVAVADFVADLVILSVPHLDDAINYTKLLPGRHRGTRMFLIVPVFLAVATLNRIKRNPVQTITGPPVKITRRDVTRLVAAASACASSNTALEKYYLRLKTKR